MVFEFAWRNIWRNVRRTLVIMTAVLIGVWSMIFLSAFARGMMENMLENGKSVLVGDIQIHHKNYREDPSIENSMKQLDEIKQALEKNLPEGAAWTDRIRVSAFVNNARHSAGITLVGINPLKEKEISFIGNNILMGDYLEEEDNSGVLVGKALLDKFDTKPGKKLIIMTRSENGEIISKAFRIRGVFNAEMEATEKGFIFVTMKGARKLTKMKIGVSEISILLQKEGNLDGTANGLRGSLNADIYSVETWKGLLPMLEAYVDMFNSFMYIWYVVVFIAMGFGIVNTSLMAVFERVREFGLLRALGMKPWRVVGSVLTESFFVLITGIIAGNFLGLISVFLVKDHGLNLAAMGKGAELVGMSRIIYPEISLNDVISINVIILFLGIIVSLYPAIRAAGITPVEAMRE